MTSSGMMLITCFRKTGSLVQHLLPYSVTHMYKQASVLPCSNISYKTKYLNFLHLQLSQYSDYTAWMSVVLLPAGAGAGGGFFYFRRRLWGPSSLLSKG